MTRRSRKSAIVALGVLLVSGLAAPGTVHAFPFVLLRLDTLEDWESISLGSGGIKYVSPAQHPETTDFPCLDSVLYGPGVQHINIIQATHLECLEDFNVGDLDRMRHDMTSFAGYIATLEDPRSGEAVCVFTVHNDQYEQDLEFTPEHLGHIVSGLRETFNQEALGRLVYLPTTERARDRVRRWFDDPVIQLEVAVFFRGVPCPFVAEPQDGGDLDGSCESFVRGDIDVDGEMRPGDAIVLLGYLFQGTRGPTCLDAADTNDDGALTLGDAVWLLRWLFLGGTAPAPPGSSVARNYRRGDCGTDPTADSLDCASFARCE